MSIRIKSKSDTAGAFIVMAHFGFINKMTSCATRLQSSKINNSNNTHKSNEKHNGGPKNTDGIAWPECGKQKQL
jgi:hypothetical protein